MVMDRRWFLALLPRPDCLTCAHIVFAIAAHMAMPNVKGDGAVQSYSVLRRPGARNSWKIEGVCAVEADTEWEHVGSAKRYSQRWTVRFPEG